MFNSDLFANRPAAGIVGRIFISTDTKVFYRDTGTTWEELSGSTIGGSLATGQVAFGSATNTISGSNNLFWDNANAWLGIGTNAPGRIVDISSNGGRLRFTQNVSADIFVGLEFATNLGVSFGGFIGNPNSGEIRLNAVASYFPTFYSNNTERARITSAGNFLLGGTTDSGQRLQVYGDAFIKGSGNTSATTGLQIENSIGINLLTINNSGFYRLSGSNGMFLSMFTTTGGTASISGSNTQFYNYTTTQAATSGAFLFTGDSFVQTSGAVHTIYINKGFLPTSGNASFSNLTITPSNINQTGGANGITRGIYIQPTLTAAADWRSIEWSNNTGFGLYGAGTCANYLGGNLLIKTTTDTGYSAQITSASGDSMLNVWGATAPSIRLDNAASGATRRFVIGLATATNNFIQGAVANDACIATASSNPLLFGMWVSTSATEVMRISTALNLQIGSITDTGEKFQLTGSIRVNGQLSGSSGGNSGQHLIINCDGTTYKIKLENV
jgi:hypothetical protein